MLLTGAVGAASASEPVFEPGFQGAVQPGVAVVSTKSISSVTDENQRIDSLDQDADSETEFAPILLWETTYTLEGGSTQLFAGTPGENIVEGNFFLEAGIRRALRDGTVLSLSLIPGIPLLDDEVWSDPFLTGSDRQETDRESMALQLAADDILGTPFFCRYGFATQEIDNEQSGQYLVDQGTITGSEAAALRRDADFHRFEAGMALPLNDMGIVIPAVHYMMGDADGDANSFNNFGGQVTFMFPRGRYEFFTSFSMDYLDYDAENPVFDKTREDLLFELGAGVTIPQPFEFESVSLTFLAGFSKRDSNIGFYDSEDLMAGMTIGWHF